LLSQSTIARHFAGETAKVIGHPLGATDARLTVTLIFELRRRNLRFGIASACIGGGQGIALLMERI
jgi:acetyl-CoA acetyltransferase